MDHLSKHIETQKAKQVKLSVEIIRLAKNIDEIFRTHSSLKDSLPVSAMASFQRSKLAAIPERDAVAGKSKTADTSPPLPRSSRFIKPLDE